jgi:hypothetical protein
VSSALHANSAPLVVTAELPSELQAWADKLRRAHYPAERNRLPAHVTLFHALPPSSEGEARGALGHSAATYAPPQARLDGLMSLGRGTALALSSGGMLHVRDELADRFHGLLSAQDAGRPRLHVTIQNKVTLAEAIKLQAELSPLVEPRGFAFAGLALHAYRGGPWELIQRWPFRGRERAG